MALEVVGRHAMFFDDDANAAFVNSEEALVEWNLLPIDRYDVRHLLSGPPPPRNRRRQAATHPDAALEPELDRERFLDLPSDEQEQDKGKDAEPVSSGSYTAVGFSYGHVDEAAQQKNSDVESVYRPPFPVPGNLIQNLPLTEKIHHIMAKTASFVSKHGGQSEIVLRVKQGDNPTFGFLMPDHHLHPYFRFLVDNQELLKYSEVDIKSLELEKKVDSKSDQTGGALALLGSIYGYEDEDGASEDVPNRKQRKSWETVEPMYATVSHGSKSLGNADVKNETLCSITDKKDKVHTVKRNPSINTIKNPTSVVSRDGAESSSVSISSKVELPIVEPPAELKRVVEKIVEFILRNGKEFEAVLAEQDRKFGRFPFLVSSNQYHPYYLQVLHNLPNSQPVIEGSVLEKHGKGDEHPSVMAEGDIPNNNDNDKKEKFKMTLAKAKKDEKSPTPKPNLPPSDIVIDAEAAAAILKAATRGIKNPCLELFPKLSRRNSDDTQSDDAGKPSSQKRDVTEADSSEASLTRELKLKAERLRRAKMFTAMVKSGAAPLKPEVLRSVSVEPPRSGVSSANDTGYPLRKESEAISVPVDLNISEKIEKFEKKTLVDEPGERQSKRSYRSKSMIDIEEEENLDGKLDHSRKKHRLHRSSRHGKDKHRHRESQRRRHQNDVEEHSGDNDRASRHRRKHSMSSEEDEYRSSTTKRQKHYSSEDDRERRCHRSEHRHRHRHKHGESSSDDDEGRRRSKSGRHRKHKSGRESESEEGEIHPKFDQPKANESRGDSTEAPIDFPESAEQRNLLSRPAEVSEVPDDLRAKIRAMLMATM